MAAMAALCAALVAPITVSNLRASRPTEERPAGLLLVLNKSINSLAIVDPVTLQVLGRVPTGVGPHEVAASADGRTAYVANYGDRDTIGETLSIIDIASRKELQKLELGDLKRPHGIAVSNGKVYFTSEIKQSVARYDPKSNKVDWTASTGQKITHMLVPSPDGKKIYTANIFSNTVSIIDIATGKATHIAVGARPEGLDVSPSGRELWVSHTEDGGLSIVDTETGKVKDTLKVGQMPIRVKFTPDGKRVLVSDAKAGELIIYDAETRKEIKRMHIGAIPVGVLIEPSGKRAYVASMSDNKVTVLDLGSLTITGSVEPGGAPDGMAWASIGKT
jgi:YVTN family beta-propeller protein